MSDRMTRLVVILDKENKESREMEAELQETMGCLPVDSLPIQRVRSILPGIRATPAVGVLFWASDLQGLAADVDNFASYIKGEEDITAALVELGVNTEEDAPVTEGE